MLAAQNERSREDILTLPELEILRDADCADKLIEAFSTNPLRTADLLIARHYIHVLTYERVRRRTDPYEQAALLLFDAMDNICTQSQLKDFMKLLSEQAWTAEAAEFVKSQHQSIIGNEAQIFGDTTGMIVYLAYCIIFQFVIAIIILYENLTMSSVAA